MVIAEGTPVSSCTNVEDGSYHSTGNCNEYVTCSNGVMSTHTCSANQYFDDASNACGAITSTCTDACNENPCSNGVCSYDGDGYSCSCNSGFSGDNCGKYHFKCFIPYHFLNNLVESKSTYLGHPIYHLIYTTE